MWPIRPSYLPRLIDPLLAELLGELPAVLLVGPRACGKTTTARRLARTVVRLDRAVEAQPFRDDPDVVLASLDPPVLLDEWQAVPGVLGSVKRSIDDDGGIGRFLLTGSVRADLLDANWAATGRVVRVTQWGLTERELAGRTGGPSFFDRLFEGALADPSKVSVSENLRTYVELAVRGTFPDTALAASEAARLRWLDAYVQQMLVRDASLAGEDRDPVKLRRYLTAIAANTAGVVEHKTLYDAAGVSRITGSAYDALLELLFVAELVPAWHTNRLNRLTRSAKRYVVDAAVAALLLGVDARAVLRNGDLLGRFIDTFVLSQLRPEAEVASCRPRLHHLRLDGGSREVDLIAEARDGRVAGIEIKSTAAPTASDAAHLAWLRDRLGDRFVTGVVFHTGPRGFRLGERLLALPIATLWAADDVG